MEKLWGMMGKDGGSFCTEEQKKETAEVSHWKGREWIIENNSRYGSELRFYCFNVKEWTM